jgi:hypothetical protein
VIGCINFEDHALIKRWRVSEKMNVIGGMFKDKKKEVTIENSLRLLLEVVHIFAILELEVQ